MSKLYKNPLIAVLIAFFIIVVGIKNYLGLPIALYPNTSKAVIRAYIDFRDISLIDFKAKYGTKVERALSSLENVEFVDGSYENGSAFWDTHFSWDVKTKKAEKDIEDVLSQLNGMLPEAWGRFHSYPRNSQNSEIAVSLSSGVFSQAELQKKFESRALGELESIKGVEGVGFFLPGKEYVRIELKPSLMEALGLSPDRIKKILFEKRYDEDLGQFDLGKNHYHLLIPKRSKSLEELRNTLLYSQGGKHFRLEDFSEISIQTKHFSNLMKANGKKALVAFASVKSSGNISYVAEKVIETLERARDEVDSNISLNLLLNPSSFIEEAVKNVFLSILLGILIATLVIFLFLGSLSHTFVVALSIPLSVIGGFSLMALLGIEINLISLGALALSVGMVVDGAIVVLENIAKDLELKKPRNLKERSGLFFNSVAQIRSAVIASLLTTIIVFAPLSFTAPLANALLGDLAKVMVCVLVISVLVTLYLIPPILLFFRSTQVEIKKKGIYFFSFIFSSFLKKVESSYLSSLRFFIRSRKATYFFFTSLFLLLFSSLFVLLFHVKREIIATPDSDKIWLFVNYQEEKTMEESEEFVSKEVESLLERDFSSYYSHYFTQVRKWNSSVLLTLKDKSLQDEIKVKLERVFHNTARVRFHVMPWNPTSLKIPKEPLVDILISPEDKEEGQKILKSLSEIFSKKDFIGETVMNPSPHRSSYYEMKMDHEKISRIKEEMNVDLASVISSSTKVFVDQDFLYPISIGEKDYDIFLSYPEGLIETVEDFKNILFKIDGRYYPLRNFAYLEKKEQEAELSTRHGRPYYQAKVWVKSAFEKDRETLKEKLLEEIKNHKDINLSALSFEETGKEINESLYSLLNAFFIALFLVLFVLVFLFGSFKQSFVIMLAIPLGFVGVSFSLYVFSSTLSLNSMLGLILLSGTAVNNSILLTDVFNKIYCLSSLEELEDSLLRAASLRFRPILITTLTTILGMFPIALALDSGGKVLQPLGIAVCGGLGVSTLLTLFVIPLVLYFIEGRRWKL